jgi:hypothetical protein
MKGIILTDNIKLTITHAINFQNKVPITKIYYSCKKCYVNEGFGGQQITLSPIYCCIKEYIHGDKQLAIKAWCDWYQDQFNKYHNVSKAHGGMHKGSLFRLILKHHKIAHQNITDMKDADPIIIKNAICQRVAQRLLLAEQIINEGYEADLLNPITAIKKNGKYYLIGGHHRVCILAAMGEKFIPKVYIKRSRLIKDLCLLIVKLKSHLSGN